MQTQNIIEASPEPHLPSVATSTPLLPFSPLTPNLLIVLQSSVPYYIRNETHTKSSKLLHFTSLEADDIHQHSVTIVQTTLNVTSYTKSDAVKLKVCTENMQMK